MKRKEFLEQLLKISQLNQAMNPIKDIPFSFCKPAAYVTRTKAIHSQHLGSKNIFKPKAQIITQNCNRKVLVVSRPTKQITPYRSFRKSKTTVDQDKEQWNTQKYESAEEPNQKQANLKIEVDLSSPLSQSVKGDSNISFVKAVNYQSRSLNPKNFDKSSLEILQYNNFNNKSRNGSIRKIIRKLSNVQDMNDYRSQPGQVQVVNPKQTTIQVDIGSNSLTNKPNSMCPQTTPSRIKHIEAYKAINKMNYFNPKTMEEQQKHLKIKMRKQINKNYAKPFVPPPKISATSYIIGQIFDNGDERKIKVSFNSKNSQQVASLTKIMTCITILQLSQNYSIDLSTQEVKIGKMESSIGGTTAHLKMGQIYTIQQLLYGLMLPSGNDASVALAVWGGKLLINSKNKDLTGKEMGPISDKLTSLDCSSGLLKDQKLTKNACYNRFIAEMNEKAKSLKMNKTFYANSHGLSNSCNKSSAFDIAILSQYSIRNQHFRKIVSSKKYCTVIKYQEQLCEPEISENSTSSNSIQEQILQTETIPSIDPKNDLKEVQNEKKMVASVASAVILKSMQIEWQNTHKLLRSKPDEYVGIKTGFTTTAGPCLSSCIAIDQRKFIIVVLGCTKINLRFRETEILKRWLFKHEGIIKKNKKGSNVRLMSEEEMQNNSQCGANQANQKLEIWQDQNED